MSSNHKNTNKLSHALLGVVKMLNPLIPDKQYLKMLFRLKMGCRLDLKNPKTFNEKLQWLKLYDRKPEYTTMVDKYAVKEYVANIIGEEYVIPTLGVWNKPGDIEWDKLPNQFVLKTTHSGGSTGVVICRDKDHLDKQLAMEKLKVSLGKNVFHTSREWPYKNVHPRIIAEKYMADNIIDYKFFCFNGVVKAMFVATDRQKEGEDVKFDFFDADYNHLPFRQGHENAKELPQCPKSFVLMKRLAESLSRNIPQVRVDLYEIDGRPYFGEMTFFHFGGWVPFNPEIWDKKMGEWLELPNE